MNSGLNIISKYNLQTLISASSLAQGDQQQLNYSIDSDITTRKGRQRDCSLMSVAMVVLVHSHKNT